MFCKKCGKNNHADAKFCVGCGEKLNPVVVVVDEGNVFIPKNTMAIWSYYLGLASVICCITTGIPAMVTGIIALNRAKLDPSLKGHVHAWVGIIFGGISVIFIILMLMMRFAAR